MIVYEKKLMYWFKVVWLEQAPGEGEEYLYGLYPVERREGKPRGTLEEVIKRGLMINKIVETLFSNWTKWLHIIHVWTLPTKLWCCLPDIKNCITFVQEKEEQDTHKKPLHRQLKCNSTSQTSYKNWPSRILPQFTLCFPTRSTYDAKFVLLIRVMLSMKLFKHPKKCHICIKIHAMTNRVGKTFLYKSPYRSTMCIWLRLWVFYEAFIYQKMNKYSCGI